MNINNLYLVKELAETDKQIQEQEEEFMKITQKSRASFYRYRKRLGLRSRNKPYQYTLKDIGICYFCLKKAEEIHHINQNPKDDREENKLPLCKSCHVKITRVLVCRNK